MEGLHSTPDANDITRTIPKALMNLMNNQSYCGVSRKRIGNVVGRYNRFVGKVEGHTGVWGPWRGLTIDDRSQILKRNTYKF